MNKYEQLIEYIINDQEDKARELFHSIVVEKSRNIYESLMADEMDETIDRSDSTADLVDEISADESGEVCETDLEVGDPDSADGSEMGDDLGGDDMGDDTGDDIGGGDDMGDDTGDDMGDMDGEGDTEEKFQNIKDAIADLEAEFAQLMGDSSDEGDEIDLDGDADDSTDMDADASTEEEPSMMEEGNPFAKSGSGSGKSGSGKSGSGKSGSGKSGAMSEAEMMREYVEKISAPSNTEFTPAGTTTGGDKASGNTKSTVAGKNDMGGTTANIAKGGAEQAPDGNSPKGKAGGFVKSAQEIDVAKRNVNKVGGNKGAQDFYNTKAKAKAGEGQTTDGSVPVNKHSLESGKK